MVGTMSQQYNIGEKPTVILYTHINRHAGTPKKRLTNKNIVVYIPQPKLIRRVCGVLRNTIAPVLSTCPLNQHAHFIPIVGVGKRGEYDLVHGDLPRQHSFETTLTFTGPVPADSGQ